MIVFTYLLQSIKDDSFYTGISDDPQKRLKEHNRGSLKTTVLKRPWKLVYEKAYDSYIEARKHEKWLKKKNAEYKKQLAG